VHPDTKELTRRGFLPQDTCCTMCYGVLVGFDIARLATCLEQSVAKAANESES
jgi:hypothetical protein